MLDFWRKRSTNQAGQDKDDCSGDESCPMCQVSDKVMETFKNEDKTKEATHE